MSADIEGCESTQADPGRVSTNVRNGSRGKTVISDAAGEVRIEVPRIGKERLSRRL